MVEDGRAVDESFAVVEHQRGYAEDGIESAQLIRHAENRKQVARKRQSQRRKGDADPTYERRIVVTDQTPDHALPPRTSVGWRRWATAIARKTATATHAS